MGGSPNSLVLRVSESCNMTQGMYILPPILVIGSVERVLEIIVGAKSPHFFSNAGNTSSAAACCQYLKKMAPHLSTNAETEGSSRLSIF